MAAVTLSLLGPPQITRADRTTLVLARKELALLAYLAIECRQAHSRDTLLGMFWPESPEEAARNSLRVALSNLRATLGEAGGPYLSTSRHSVQFSSASDHTLDVAAFGALLTARHAYRHEDGKLCAECAARLTQAIALYRGDFLSGFALPDSTAFEEWALIQREQLHQQALEALGMLAAYHDQQGDYAALVRAARRQIELEPWREQAHRQLMRALAAMGDRAAALAAYQRCRQVLHAELGIEPEEETRALYERISGGELSPVSSHAPAPALSLPEHLTPFVGRERELAEIAARLRQADVRLLTLVGAGGMGKTRLALEIARLRLADLSSDRPDLVAEPARPAFLDGAFFVSLAPLTAAAAIVPAITTAIGLSLHGDPKQVLLHFLRDRQLLLILDNFEHLLDGPSSSSGQGVDLVLEILQTAPLVKLIATSRERLKLRGEHVYIVEGMDYRAEDRATSSAIRLFVQSARRVRADFKVSEEKLPLLLRICDLVHGMPLGIELAAAWVEMLPLKTIAAEIERSADFLAFDWRDAPERQRSMRAVFDWSWHLLNEAERQALRGLSVFRGGCTLAAAQAVVNASLRVLTSLVHKSLLRWSRGQGEVGRYEMHELLRQFAAEHLVQPGEEAEQTNARHSAFYLRFVAEREGRMARDEPQAAGAEIGGEIDNIQQAWAWAAAHGSIDIVDASAWGLWQYYKLVGVSTAGEQIFRLAAERLHEQLEQLGTDEPVRGRTQRVASKLLALYACALVERNRYEETLSVAERAISLAQSSGGVEGESIGRFARAKALVRKGQYLQARAELERALDLALSYQHDRASYESFGALASLIYVLLMPTNLRLGDYSAASSYGHKGLQLCQRLGMRFGEASLLCNLADVARETRDLPTARNGYEQALDLAIAAGYRWYEGIGQMELGDVVRLQGEYGLALKLTQRALAILREIGDTLEAARAAAHLGRLYSYLGDYTRAQDCFAQFVHGASMLDSPEMVVEGLLPLAMFVLHHGDAGQALAHAERAWQLGRVYSSPYMQAHALVVLAHAQAVNGRQDAAATYQQALERYEALGSPALAVEPLAALASVVIDRGDQTGALAHVEVVLKVLADHPRAGMDEPFGVYLRCYRILTANGDPRAIAVLNNAHVLLEAYASEIGDASPRQSFLENVASHREIMQAWSALPRGREAAEYHEL